MRGLFREPEFVALAAIKFATAMAFATILIALALYADQFAVSGLVAGLFGTVYALVRLGLVLPVGRYIDLGDAKKYLVAGVLLNACVLVGYTFVGSEWHVILMRVLQSAGATVLIVGGTAVVGEIAPDEERGLWIGTHNQVGSAASLSGDLVGGAMLYGFGFGPTWTVLTVLNLIAAGLAITFLRGEPGGRKDPEDGSGVETYRTLLERAAVRALVVFRFAFSFGKMAVILFLPIFARVEFGMNPLLIGGILAGGKLTKALSQGYVGSVADKIGREEYFIVAGTLLYAAGTALIPFATYAAVFGTALTIPIPAVAQVGSVGSTIAIGAPFFVLFAAYAVLGFADCLRLPTSMALFVEEGEHYDAVSSSLSLRSMSWQVGAVVGPVAVGAVSDSLSYYGAFWLASGTMLIAAVVFIWMFSAEPAPEPSMTPGTGD